MEKYYAYIKIKDKDEYVTYNPGNFGKDGYYLTNDLNKAFYFGIKPLPKMLEQICNEICVNIRDIEIITDEHYKTGLSNLRSIIYKRNKW